MFLAMERIVLQLLPTIQCVDKSALIVESFLLFEVKNDDLDRAAQLNAQAQIQFGHP